MGVFQQFPYTNFHEMNLDEIIRIVKDMVDRWSQYYTEWDDWKEQVTQEWSDMQQFINDYFDNLDVQQEINTKINSMVASGEFSAIVDPFVPPAAAAWLADHITQPTTPAIDTSLSVAGAAADAKAAGDGIATLKNALSSSIDIAWSKGGINAVGSVSETDNSTFTTEIIKNASWAYLTGCTASVYLYNGNTYLGKVINAAGDINQTSGQWYRYSDTIPIGMLMYKNNADGVRIAIAPNDTTVITYANAETWADSCANIIGSTFESVEALKHITASTEVDSTVAWIKGYMTVGGVVLTNQNAVLSNIIPIEYITHIKILNGAFAYFYLYDGDTYLGKIGKTGDLGTDSGFMFFCAEIPINYIRSRFTAANAIRLCVVPSDSTTITTANAQSWGDENTDIAVDGISTNQTAIATINSKMRYADQYMPAFIKGTINATENLLLNQNGVFTTEIITLPSYLKIEDNAEAAIFVYKDGAYLGKVVNDNYVINKTEGQWKRFTGEVDVIQILSVNNANGIRISMNPTDSTIITMINADSWGKEHARVCSSALIPEFNFINYAIGSDFTKHKSKLSALGSFPINQAFCKYGSKYYVVTAANLYVIDVDFQVEQTLSFDFGHGNSIQLGNSNLAYVSGCTGEYKNDVYVLNLDTLQIDNTITLPFGSEVHATTAVIDEINKYAYVITVAEPNTAAPTDTSFVIYDYDNQEILYTKKIARKLQAFQSCDFCDGRIILVYGYENPYKQMPNGYIVLNTAGDIIGEYILPSINALEPEGIFVDRTTRDVMISAVTGEVYQITN